MKQQQSNDLIDYAYPCMMAEKTLKDLHNAAIEGRLDDAIVCAMNTITHALETYQALVHMQATQKLPARD